MNYYQGVSNSFRVIFHCMWCSRQNRSTTRAALCRYSTHALILEEWFGPNSTFIEIWPIKPSCEISSLQVLQVLISFWTSRLQSGKISSFKHQQIFWVLQIERRQFSFIPGVAQGRDDSHTNLFLHVLPTYKISTCYTQDIFVRTKDSNWQLNK